MNYIKEVAKLLGYEIREKFNIIYNTGSYSGRNRFKVTEKPPFIPKVGEVYWSYNDIIWQYIWDNTTFHKERRLLGVVFRTEQEAIDYLPTWLKRLEGEEV